MKIYTKTGDSGETSLIGGTRVPKHHLRIETYGTVDELNSWIGLLRDQDVDDHSITTLLEVQDRLFTIGSRLASDPDTSRMKLPELCEDDILHLESEMDRMETELPELKSFVLPGGHTIVSYCHVARCVCRRAERLVSQLKEVSPVEDRILRYLNRLSDYLFMLSRHFAQTLNAPETPWTPRM
ncbi:MAG: cob(I)yrinic acid a,c-diamide adenosyltransferase [Sphingobacteriales bacterium]|jgi:cob(I)alamin adenosyltransferase|nr:cob(I)yrinic acid a,c-diamide adenosyltransferase [Sphingobacteriales bacterium]